MTDQEFENIIKNSLKTNANPDRGSFSHLLSILNNPVTEIKQVRYSIQTPTSNIISNRITSFISIWRSNRIILVPSFILLLFIGIFSLSMHTTTYGSSIEQLAQKDESIKELAIVDDDDPALFLTGFDEPDINDLSILQYDL